MFGSRDDEPTVRDYVYLDNSTMDSWYASLNGWIPESRQQSRGREQGGEANVQGKGEAALPLLEWIGKLGFEGGMGASVSTQRMTETADRIIDQGLHTQLREDLKDNDLIKPLNSNLEHGDVVEVTGSGMTDPLFRALFAIKRLIALEIFEEDEEETESVGMNEEMLMGPMDEEDLFGFSDEDLFGGGRTSNESISQNPFSLSPDEELEKMINAIYGENTCLLLDIDEDQTKGTDGSFKQCGMLMSKEHLQTGQSEFLSPKRYTALGRVVEIAKDGDWNYAEVLRVAETVMEESEVTKMRTDIEESFQDMGSSEGLEVDDEMFSTEDPLVVIKPVAVYW